MFYKIIYPFTFIAVLTAGFLFFSIEEKVKSEGYQLAEGKINPFAKQDTTFLREMRQEGFHYLNEIRTKEGLPSFSMNEALNYSAQSHSNYLVKYPTIPHLETNKNDKQSFTGKYPKDRSKYYQYSGSGVGEILTFQTNNTKNAIDNLLDAPYHRVTMLDPNYTEVGIGFNDTINDINPTVIELGNIEGSKTNKEPVIYPFNHQKKVKTTWFENENPNPLRFWNLSKVSVGYPISISYYGNNNEKILAKTVKVEDEKGNHIPFYLVDGAKDNNLSSIFIIPKEPLKQGMTYTVTVKANKYGKLNQITQIDNTWSFTTEEGYHLTDIALLSTDNGTKVLKPYFSNGAINTVKYEILRNGVKVQTYNEKGVNGYLGYGTITNGEYDLILTFTDSDQIIKLKINISNKTVSLLGDPPTNT